MPEKVAKSGTVIEALPLPSRVAGATLPLPFTEASGDTMSIEFDGDAAIPPQSRPSRDREASGRRRFVTKTGQRHVLDGSVEADRTVGLRCQLRDRGVHGEVDGSDRYLGRYPGALCRQMPLGVQLCKGTIGVEVKAQPAPGRAAQ